MSELDIHSATLDEIVFEDRNKSYGGYFLRVLYDWNITRAVIISCITFTVLALGIYYYYKSRPVEEDVEEEVIVNMTLESKPIDESPEKKLPPPPPPKVKPPEVKMFKFIPPVIKLDHLVNKEENLAKIDSITQTAVGTQNQQGVNDLNHTEVFEEEGVPGGTGKPEPTIYNYAEEMPKFRNGPEDLMKYIRNHTVYPQDAKAKNMSGTVNIEVIIDAAGQVSSVKVVKGKGSIYPSLEEAALKVVKGMPNEWTPGKMNGNPVLVRMIIPVAFKLTD